MATPLELDQVCALIPSLIDKMPDTFDSHELIFRLFKDHKPLYIALLKAYRTPERAEAEAYRLADAAIGRMLLDYPQRITPQGKRDSLTIRNSMSACEVWKKVEVT